MRFKPKKNTALPGTYKPVESETVNFFYHGMGPCGSRRRNGDIITVYGKISGGQRRAAVTVP